MRREDRQVMGRVDYILRLDQDSFSKVGGEGGKTPYRP